MNTVKECAELYNALLNKEYLFRLENNIQFSIFFSASNFYHLLGLEKLSDIAQLKGKKSNQIYKHILNNRIQDNIIKKSNYYYLIESRIKNFEIIPDLLNFDKSNKIIVDFDLDKLNFKSKLQFTKYILFKRNNSDYIHLTIGLKDKLYPETFIVENGSTYISNQTMLDILGIEVTERRR
ncbi:MAG: PBECR4 domain-containing protein [Clostridiales bacterium]|nr:PBECR4 domain-containing protein [Clostridiales bacterium]